MKGRHLAAVVLALAAGGWVAISVAQGDLGGGAGTGTGIGTNCLPCARHPHSGHGSGGGSGRRTPQPTGSRKRRHHSREPSHSSGSGASSSGSAQGSGNCPGGLGAVTDPQTALPLPGGAIAPAVHAALLFSEHQDGSDARARQGARVFRARLALSPRAVVGQPGQVLRRCGRHLASRTVVVSVFFPNAPPGSGAYSEVWVSRFAPNTYRVWHVVY